MFVDNTVPGTECILNRYLLNVLNDLFRRLTKYLQRQFSFTFVPCEIKKRKSRLELVTGRPVKGALTPYHYTHHPLRQLPQTGSHQLPKEKEVSY